ncbi:taste receptor type 2 member 40-like [Phyllobates terribilis]|uniref:taste receptor type 2 member 40-like n=1 Tax=Phyllobates terribilis TaxID=111132 RepID=UPI003CCB2459
MPVPQLKDVDVSRVDHVVPAPKLIEQNNFLTHQKHIAQTIVNQRKIPPTFIVASMTILGASTIFGVFTNLMIVTVNFVDKVRGRKLNPSDLIMVTLGTFNVFFQFIMLINDYVSFLNRDLYSSDQIYTLFTMLLILPIFSSFWFTVCLSVYYYLQIIIFTHPFLIRLKLGVSELIPKLLMASIFTSVANGIPAAWYRYKDHLSLNISSNQGSELTVPKVNVVYMLPSTIISSSLPLTRNSPGFCACLMIIYIYPPAQSMVLITGSPKLKQISLALLRCLLGKKQPKTIEILVIKL